MKSWTVKTHQSKENNNLTRSWSIYAQMSLLIPSLVLIVSWLLAMTKKVLITLCPWNVCTWFMITVQPLFCHVRHQHTAGQNHTVSNSYFSLLVLREPTGRLYIPLVVFMMRVDLTFLISSPFWELLNTAVIIWTGQSSQTMMIYYHRWWAICYHRL